MKKLIALTLSLMMTATLAGCGSSSAGTEGSSSSNTGSSAAAETTEATATEADADAEPVDITWLGYYTSNITVAEDSYAEQVLEDYFNVNITPVTDVTQDTMDTFIASGDILDVTCYNYYMENDYEYMLDQGLIRDFPEEWLWEYYPTGMKILQEWLGEDFFEDGNHLVDGKCIYTPWVEGKTYSTSVLVYRKDWMENLGMSEPTTLDELHDLLYAFTYNDPDGNGQDDTYGYTCSGDLMWYNNWIFQAMDSTYWGWVDTSDGSVTASWVTDENKAAVSFLNRLYEEGIMDPDYTAMTDPTKIQNFCSNRTGIMVDNVYYNTYVEQLRAANNLTREEAEAAVAVIAPPKGETGTYGTRGNPGFWCGVCIRGDLSENKISAILDLLEFMLSDKGYDLFTYGVEGEHYEVDPQGQKVSLMGVDANGYNFTVKSLDPAFDTHMFVDWSLSYNPGFSSNYDLVEQFMEMAEGYTHVDSTVYVQTPLFISNWDTIGQDSYEYFVRLISSDFQDYNKEKIGTVDWDTIEVSNAAFDSAWDTYKNQFLSAWGGQALIDEYAEAAKAYLE